MLLLIDHMITVILTSMLSRIIHFNIMKLKDSFISFIIALKLLQSIVTHIMIQSNIAITLSTFHNKHKVLLFRNSGSLWRFLAYRHPMSSPPLRSGLAALRLRPSGDMRPQRYALFAPSSRSYGE